jgi:hypothetical protein
MWLGATQSADRNAAALAMELSVSQLRGARQSPGFGSWVTPKCQSRLATKYPNASEVAAKHPEIRRLVWGPL